MIAANPKIERLMLAIAGHEDWSVPGQNTAPGGSRAFRNHNPGNLRASPFAAATVEGFAVFRSDFVGWMALHWDLMQKAHGNTRTKLGPESTVRELIFTYAPPSDGNDSEKYLQDVLEKTGFQESTTLGEIFEM